MCTCVSMRVCVPTCVQKGGGEIHCPENKAVKICQASRSYNKNQESKAWSPTPRVKTISKGESDELMSDGAKRKIRMRKGN